MRPPDGKINVLHMTVGLGLGGAEKVLADFATGLNPAEFNVEVLSLKGEGTVGEKLKAAWVPVTALNGRGLWDATAYARAARFLRAKRFDVIHAHVFWANLLACRLKGGSRMIWHEHDTDEWMSIGHKALERAVIPRADKVLAISQAVAGCLERRNPGLRDRIAILPNTVRVKNFEVPAGTDKASLQKRLFPWSGPVAGYVGRLDEPKKGLSVFLRAAALVLKSQPDARFVIMGEGAAESSLRALHAALRLGDRCVFLPPRLEVAPVYHALDFFVLPSLWEGFGIALLEAMAAGLPVAASRVGGIPEVVEDGRTGLLAPPGDAEALAAVLSELFAHPARREDLGRAGLERVREKFSLEKNIAQLETIYRGLMA